MAHWPYLLLAYGFSALVGGLFVRVTAKQLYRSLSAEAVDEHEALVRLSSLVGFLERILYTYLWSTGGQFLIGLWLLAKVVGRRTWSGSEPVGKDDARSSIPARARFNIFLVNSALSLVFGIGSASILAHLRLGDNRAALLRAILLCVVGFGAWFWAWLSPKIASKPAA